MKNPMTLEHKVLTLIDRGVSSERDVLSVCGTEAEAKLGVLECAGRVRWVGVHLSMTADGLDRLNELDDELTKL